MTNYNERLDKVLVSFYNHAAQDVADNHLQEGKLFTTAHTEAKQAITDWHNKQVEAVLDRLLREYELDTQSKWFSSSGGMVDLASAIEAERNKLQAKGVTQ